ncbi:MAG: biotin/lipoyl-binding protein, partial [Alloalcanivorax venustensis]|uniref:biotin/lipoyl-binding protein n=1 Tax=Alloalcanivorax venustensis TaxID=172371 RepID=UPI003C4FC4D7
MTRWIKGHLRIVVLVVLAVLGAAWWWLSGNGATAGQWQTARVQTADIEDLVTALGTLEPYDYVDVGAQVSGQLEKLHVDLGDRVKKGQLLAEIDAS